MHGNNYHLSLYFLLESTENQKIWKSTENQKLTADINVYIACFIISY